MADVNGLDSVPDTDDEQIQATVPTVTVRIYGSGNKWSAQIANGYYHWNCPKAEAIDKAEQRVNEIMSDQIKLTFKNKFRK